MHQQQRQHMKEATYDDEQAHPISNVLTGENNVAQLEAIATALSNQV